MEKMTSELNVSQSAFRMFAVTPPGLEQAALAELHETGMANAVAETGGVLFSGSLEELYMANLWLRIPNRILLRTGVFRVTELSELEERISRYPWEIYLPSGGLVKVNASLHKSRLYHSGAVEERVIQGIRHRTGKDVASWRLARKSGVAFDLLVVIRIVNDHCTVSVDSSGTDLYKRGYKKEVSRASLRENLAAGLLFAAGWDGKSAVLDPMCGSGTIVIEAAMAAAAVAPGMYRDFAFEKWSNYDCDLWMRLKEGARNSVRSTHRFSLRFFAYDHDVEAVKIARRNAQRAGVADIIRIRQQSVSRLVRPEDVAFGWIVTNPPYGKRMRQSRELTGLYSALGRIFTEHFQGWHIAMLCPDYKLQKALALSVRNIASIRNGGTRVEIISSVDNFKAMKQK